MNHEEPFEEERLLWYKPEQFYPVHIGEIFKSRYKVVGKLGYGSQSTVWLCRDQKLTKSTFVALKICTHEKSGSRSAGRELLAYEHLSSIET